MLVDFTNGYGSRKHVKFVLTKYEMIFVRNYKQINESKLVAMLDHTYKPSIGFTKWDSQMPK